jgi:hypothetical protein
MVIQPRPSRLSALLRFGVFFWFLHRFLFCCPSVSAAALRASYSASASALSNSLTPSGLSKRPSSSMTAFLAATSPVFQRLASFTKSACSCATSGMPSKPSQSRVANGQTLVRRYELNRTRSSPGLLVPANPNCPPLTMDECSIVRGQVLASITLLTRPRFACRRSCHACAVRLLMLTLSMLCAFRRLILS